MFSPNLFYHKACYLVSGFALGLDGRTGSSWTSVSILVSSIMSDSFYTKHTVCMAMLPDEEKFAVIASRLTVSGSYPAIKDVYQ